MAASFAAVPDRRLVVAGPDLAALGATHVLFRAGWLLSSSEVLISYSLALLGGVIYRFATAERKSSFFRGAVALFVGKQVAQSLEKSQKIALTGKRQTVTILFTDIRGFTAFCESKDPALVVDLLNSYMQTMVAIIVKYHGPREQIHWRWHSGRLFG